MSGLICVEAQIIDMNSICYIRAFANGFCITFTNAKELLISAQAFVKIQERIELRSSAQTEIERLTKENQHLRGIIAAMPGMGEDYKTAQLEFEHVADQEAKL